MDAHDPLHAWRIAQEPFYRAVGDECIRFEAASRDAAVILLLEYESAGALGVVVNRPTELARAASFHAFLSPVPDCS